MARATVLRAAGPRTAAAWISGAPLITTSLEGRACRHRRMGSASALRPFLDPLDEGEKRAYLGRYTEPIAQTHRPSADGSVLLPFPRLFMVATR